MVGNVLISRGCADDTAGHEHPTGGRCLRQAGLRNGPDRWRDGGPGRARHHPDFHALRSAIYTAPHRLVFFAFDLLHLDGQDLRGQPLMERRAILRKLIKQDPRSSIQFSDHIEGDGARFFKAAAELGLEGIVSKRAASRYRSGPSRSWLKIKNMVESEFILLGTERDADGVPWALLATDRDGHLAFAGPAILNPPQALKAA